MTGLIGNFALCGATLAGVGALIGSWLSWRLRERAWLERARVALYVHFGCLLTAGAALLWALVGRDFRYAYVFDHTDRSLGLLYRVSAFWSGQEGSILLWALILAVLTSIRAMQLRAGPGEWVTLGVLAAIETFFAGLTLFGASPFGELAFGGAGILADGVGLNPMLQHWAMAAHPPMLFLGYAGFALPMAIALGGLVGSEADWLGSMRRWAVFSWVCLTIGIALGAWWAYVELGWGGYWAWDPVENASLLPWLSGAALMHAIVGHKRFGGFRAWGAWLSLGTFALCVLGTSLTRSGFVQSVHAFAQSGIGVAFVGLLALLSVGGAIVLISRRRLLAGDQRDAPLLSVEGMVVAGIWLLVTMAVVTLTGTIMPLVSGSVMSSPVSVGPAYYNRAVLPLALALGAVMAVAPVLGGARPRRRLGIGAAGAAMCVASFAALGFVHAEFLICAAIAGFAVSAIVFQAIEEWLEVSRASSWSRGAAATFGGANARRLGAWAAHTGLVLVILGVAGSSIFSDRHMVRLSPGEVASVGGYTLKLDGLESVPGEGYTAAEATITLTSASGRVLTLRPQQRFYDRFSESNTEVAVRSGLGADLYVALMGWAAGGTEASLQVLINPLTMWIWIGAGIMALGGAWAIVPGLARRPVRATSATPAERGAGVSARAAQG